MLTLFGSVLGFATSMVQPIMGFLQDRADKKHEITMIGVQAEAQAKIGQLQLEATHVEADIREAEALLRHDTEVQKRASQWVVNLAASVRPVMTYLFFAEFVILSCAMFAGWIDKSTYAAIWNEPTQALWAAVVSFWFGSRTLARKGHT